MKHEATHYEVDCLERLRIGIEVIQQPGIHLDTEFAGCSMLRLQRVTVWARLSTVNCVAPQWQLPRTGLSSRPLSGRCRDGCRDRQSSDHGPTF